MRTGLILSAALALVACGGESKKQTGGTAGGEILPAAVSDAMLPHDTVRSQAPLVPNAEGDRGGGNEKQDKARSDKSAGEADSETVSDVSPFPVTKPLEQASPPN